MRDTHTRQLVLLCMRMLTLHEADNKEILYTFIDIDFRYSLIVASLFHVLSFQHSLSMANWNVHYHRGTQ